MAAVRTSWIAASSRIARAVGDALGLREFLGEGRGQVVFRRVEGDELGAGAQQAVDLAVDMAVVDADGGKVDGHGQDFIGSYAGSASESARSAVRRLHRFMPVVAMPSISRRWKNRKNRKTGTSVSDDMANSPPQSLSPVESAKVRRPSMHGVGAACR